MFNYNVHPHNFMLGTGYTVPPGKYYIGDPVHVLSHEDYSTLINFNFCQDETELYAVEKNGCLVCAITTEYGDGSYYDNESHKYVVDSGFLGVVHESLWDKDKKDKTFLGQVMNFDEETFFAKDNNGVFYCGNEIKVNTSIW